MLGSIKPHIRALLHIMAIVLIYYAAQVIVGFASTHYLVTTQEIDPHMASEIMRENLAAVTAISGGVAILAYWLLFKLSGKSMLAYCRFEHVSPSILGTALITGVGISLFLSGSMKLLQLEELFPEHQKIMQELIHAPGLAVSLLTIGIVVPVFEEIVYRGMIMGRLYRVFPVTATLIIQAIIFGAIHGNVLQGTYAGIFGILIGLSFLWSRSIWVPILIHVGWNSSSILRSYLLADPLPPIFVLITGLAVIWWGVRVLHEQTSQAKGGSI